MKIKVEMQQKMKKYPDQKVINKITRDDDNIRKERRGIRYSLIYLNYYGILR